MEDPGNGEPGSSLFFAHNPTRDIHPSPKRKRGVLNRSVQPLGTLDRSLALPALMGVSERGWGYSKIFLGLKVFEDLPRCFLR